MSDTVFLWSVCQCLILDLVLLQKQHGGCHQWCLICAWSCLDSLLKISCAHIGAPPVGSCVSWHTCSHAFSMHCFKNSPCEKKLKAQAISSATIKLTFTAALFLAVTFVTIPAAIAGCLLIFGQFVVWKLNLAYLAHFYVSKCQCIFYFLTTDMKHLSLNCLPSASIFLFLDILGLIVYISNLCLSENRLLNAEVETLQFSGGMPSLCGSRNQGALWEM